MATSTDAQRPTEAAASRAPLVLVGAARERRPARIGLALVLALVPWPSWRP